MTNVNRCKKCGSYNVKVTDSREHGCEIWRTRACLNCGARIYTTEIDREDFLDIEECKKAVRMIKEGMETIDAMGQ